MARAYFPTFKDLADAPLQHVLKTWQGTWLQQTRIKSSNAPQRLWSKNIKGKLPADYEKILDLPGIGPIHCWRNHGFCI
jgi:adenine-specific DNA glycosylase